LKRIYSLRYQIVLKSSFIVSLMHICDNLNLRSGEYAILIKSNEGALAKVMEGY
jgi:flagellar biosynthesis component FlhA